MIRSLFSVSTDKIKPSLTSFLKKSERCPILVGHGSLISTKQTKGCFGFNETNNFSFLYMEKVMNISKELMTVMLLMWL